MILKNFQSKISKNTNFLKCISIEPTVFFYYLAYIMMDLINTNLYLQKACRFNAITEPDLDTRCDDEKAGVTFLSQINTNYRQIMMSAMLLYVVFGSAWSDTAGRRRRPLIFLPMFAQLLQTILGMLQSHFWAWSAISATISDMGVQAFMGNHLLFRVSTYTYLCDISSAEDRTMRLGIMNAIKSVATPMGNAYIAYLLHPLGFFYSYLICFVLTLTAILFGFIFIKDISYPVSTKVTLLGSIRWSTITDCFKVVFKKSLGKKRFIVYALLCLHVLVWFSAEGIR